MSFTDFTSTETLARCGVWNYEALTMLDGVIDSSIFTFTPSTKTLTFQTNVLSKVGTYTIKIKGY
jgi:hypothetical protein